MYIKYLVLFDRDSQETTYFHHQSIIGILLIFDSIKNNNYFFSLLKYPKKKLFHPFTGRNILI